MNNEKKKFFFDAVGWKSYCSRLYCGAGRWQALSGLRAAGAGRACVLGVPGARGRRV